MPFRQYAKRVADGRQRDADALRNFDYRHRAQDIAPVTPLVAGIPLAVDQTLTLIKMKGRDRHAGSFCHFPGRQQHFDAG
ncbi:hypothetical protein KVMX100_250075 [Klebsiella variicola]|nr:hypothetical protein KVMX100_250075 [Klebsiella variicola]